MSRWRKDPFDAVIVDESGGNVKTLQSEYLPSGRFPIIDQGKELIAGYTDDPTRLCHAQLPVIVFGDHTRCFKYVDFPFCMGADGVKVLRPKIDADAKYLYHYLRHLRITESGYDRHFKYLKRNSIILPPLPEQRRIAAILDKADELRAKRRAALAQLDSLTQSIFLDMFGDPATNPKGWTLKRICEVAKVITGNSPSRAIPEYYGQEIEWIKSDNINTPHYYLTQADERLSELGRKVARIAPTGSILVTCIAGSRACIGNAAMTDRDVAFNQQINAVVPFEENGHFIYGWFRMAKRLVQQAATAGMKGMINKSQFEEITLIWPPSPLRKCFAQRACAIEQAARKQRATLDSMNALFSSLQHRAFRGEL